MSNNERAPEIGTLSFEQRRDSHSHDVEHVARSPTETATITDNEKTSSKLVTWLPNDPEHPMQLSSKRKWAIAASTGGLAFACSFPASVFTATVYQAGDEFNASPEVMFLGVGLFVLGYGAGPLVWGPMSELYGRTRPMWVAMVVFCFLQVPWGLARNLEAIFISRFLAGCAGSAPLSILPGVYADAFNPIQLGIAAMLFYVNLFCGPCLGPVIGSFMTENIGWRWTAWISLIMAAVATVVATLVVPETFSPLLLRRKAERLRQETKDWALHAESEEETISLTTLRKKYLIKPAQMLIREPVVSTFRPPHLSNSLTPHQLIFVTIYMSLVYAIIYACFALFPVSFLLDRKWSFGVSSLPFLALMAGFWLACLLTAIFTKRWIMPRIIRRKGLKVPEERLPMVILGAIMLPVALFWFGWSSHPSTNPASQIIAAVFIGCGTLLVFMSTFTYILDTYAAEHVNSAAVAMTLCRSVLAAAFVMFAGPMYEGIGVDWASSLLGFVCLALTPFPVLFYVYGARIRGWSRYAG